MAINGDAQKFDFREDDDDYYSQQGDLFRMFNPEEKQRLFENTARAVGPASKEVRDRHVANCTKADPRYGEGVGRALEECLQSNSIPVSTVS
jgi:catalase